MILEEETFRRFGYYPSNLKSLSDKKILAKCDICGIIREIRNSAYHNLCKSCWRVKPRGTYAIKNGMLEEETYEEFGYYPSQLKSGSSKKILVRCESCGIIRKLSLRDYRDECLRCTRKSGKYGMTGKHHTEKSKQKIRNTRRARYTFADNPMYGKHHTQESRQKISNNHADFSLEKHPQWRGGISFEPYCAKFDDDLKERVREFFGRKCFECNKIEKENNRKLDIHHVNFDKMVCCNDIKPLFVPLCQSCHPKTNFNREYWEKYFSKRIIEEYDGKCFYTKEEMKYKNSI